MTACESAGEATDGSKIRITENNQPDYKKIRTTEEWDADGNKATVVEETDATSVHVRTRPCPMASS